MTFYFKNYFLNLYLAALGFVTDRALKSFFYHGRHYFKSYTQNNGVAFGLQLPTAWLWGVIIISLLILFYLALKKWREKKYLDASLYMLIISGALSNLIDRWQYGFVIDYIDLKVWPIFNLADAMIFTGVILLIIQLNQTNKQKHGH